MVEVIGTPSSYILAKFRRLQNRRDFFVTF